MGSRVAAVPLKLTTSDPEMIASLAVFNGECAVALVILAVNVLVGSKINSPLVLNNTLGPVTDTRRPKSDRPLTPLEMLTIALLERSTKLVPFPVEMFSPPTVRATAESSPPVIVK